MRRSRKLLVAAVVVIVLVAVAGGGLYWFLRDDAPEAVELEAAVESVEEPATPDSTAPAAEGIAGSWVVDAETGELDYESATGTFAGFRIQEELASIGATTAVGRTGDVSGSITIDGTTLTEASFEVDVTTITTNESRRDDKVQEALESGEFPVATFTLTEPVELGAEAASGASVAVTAPGDLTIHGVTRPVDIALEAQLTGSTVVVVGSLDIVFSDYDVEVPESQIVLSVEDNGVMELQLLLVRG